MATGCGVVVVDIDGETGEQQAELLDLPRTLEVRTGNGRHLYFKGSSRSRVGIRPNIDVRGDGSMIILPRSRHYSGAIYEWANDLPMADLPDWVTEESQKPSPSATAKQTSGRPTVLTEGERNDRLFRWGAVMRNFAMTESEIAAALNVTNTECCRPPLDPDEVAIIAASAASYQARHVTDAALLDLQLGPIATTVYLALRRRANRNNQCWPSYEWLAEQAGVGRSSVADALALLRDVGLIDWERRVNTSNLYTLLPPPAPERNSDRIMKLRAVCVRYGVETEDRDEYCAAEELGPYLDGEEPTGRYVAITKNAETGFSYAIPCATRQAAMIRAKEHRDDDAYAEEPIAIVDLDTDKTQDLGATEAR
jgi:hypothetical protein